MAERQAEGRARRPRNIPGVCVCVYVRSASDESTESPSLSPDNKMSTGGLFQHILITGDHTRRGEALSGRRVLAAAAADRRISHLNLFILRQAEDSQMKGNEEKSMLGEELALFTHHHRD